MYLSENLRCQFCKNNFLLHKKIDEDSAILICKCRQFPLIQGILYLQDFNREKVLSYLYQGNSTKAILTLLTYKFPYFLRYIITLSIVVFLVNQFIKLKFIRYLGFNKLLYIFRLFSYKKIGLYFGNRSRLPSFYFSLVASHLIRINSSRIVDIGCGTGQFINYISRLSKSENIFGIDKSIANLFLAKIFFIPPKTLLICCDVEQGLPFHDNNIDFLYVTDTFHYVYNKSKFIGESSRIITKKGVLAMLHISSNEKKIELVTGLHPFKMSKILYRYGFNHISTYSNTTFWELIMKNAFITLGKSDSFKKIKKCYAYSIFASKSNLSRTINLSQNEFNLLNKNKIIYFENQIR